MNTTIRVRTGLAVIMDGKILLVPHYNTDTAPILWYLPGGGVEYGEKLATAAVREFYEETGFHACIEQLIDVSEVVRPEKPWHSITISFLGTIIGGSLIVESDPAVARYGDKTPRWFSWSELEQVKYHPPTAVQAAFSYRSSKIGK